jgi:hypothetical protein
MGFSITGAHCDCLANGCRYAKDAQEGPTPAQERDHLAEQCAELLHENKRLRAALEEIGNLPDEDNEWHGRDM